MLDSHSDSQESTYKNLIIESPKKDPTKLNEKLSEVDMIINEHDDTSKFIAYSRRGSIMNKQERISKTVYASSQKLSPNKFKFEEELPKVKNNLENIKNETTTSTDNPKSSFLSNKTYSLPTDILNSSSDYISSLNNKDDQNNQDSSLSSSNSTEGNTIRKELTEINEIPLGLSINSTQNRISAFDSVKHNGVIEENPTVTHAKTYRSESFNKSINFENKSTSNSEVISLKEKSTDDLFIDSKKKMKTSEMNHSAPINFNDNVKSLNSIKLNDKNPNSCIIESPEKEANSMNKQQLIRKNRKTESRMLELIKNKDLIRDNSEEKEQTLIDGSIKIPSDPLEKFDQAHLKILSFLDANELEKVMPVTYNSEMDSYNVKITKIITFKEISRSFYLSLDGEETSFGRPTCLKIIGSDIIFGSSRGTIHLFDLKNEKHRFTFGMSKESTYGPITSFDIIDDQKFLVAGHENGHIIVWDYIKKTQIKVLTDLHKMPILCLKIIKSTPLTFLTIDALGNVLMIEVEKLLMYQKVESTYIFTQSAYANIIDMKILNRDISSYKKVNYVGDEEIVIAFTSFKAIHFTALEPKSKSVKLIYKFARPPFVKENSIPSICWCDNIFDGSDQKDQYYILVGWGNSLSLLEFYSLGNKIELKGEGVIQMNFEVIFSTLISRNLIFTITTENDSLTNSVKHSINVVHSSEFKKTLNNDTLKEDQLSTINDDNLVIYHETLDMEYLLSSQKYLYDQQSKLYSTYHNSITILSDTYESIVIGTKALYKVKLISWNEYLDELIENNSWKEFFTLSLAVLNHDVKELAGIPDDENKRRELLIPYFRTQLLKYATKYIFNKENTEVNLDSNDNDSDAVRVTKSIIDFCIEAKMEEFLFLDIKKVFVAGNLNELFLATLEPFIKTNRITEIPTPSNQVLSPLREIIKFFTSPQQNKRDLIQQMISNLNLEKVNTDELMNLCLELKLDIALIYICTQADDFITPLIRFMGEYSQAQREGKSPELTVSGSRCLWYMKMCFKRRMFFKDEDIPTDKWKKIICQITELLMVEEYLRLFFNKLNPAYTINIISMLFEGKASKILESSYGQIRIGPNRINNKNNDNKLNNDDNLHNHIIQILIEELINKAESESQKQKNKLYIGFIYAKMLLCVKNPINDEKFCLELAEYLIKSHTQLDELIIINFKIMLPIKDSNGDKIDPIEEIKNKIGEEYLMNTKNIMIKTLIMNSQNELKTLENVKRITRYLETSPFVEVLIYVLTLNEEYIKAFEKYLQSSIPKKTRDKVIDWALDIMDQFQSKNDENVEKLKNCVLERMHELIAINPERTKFLLDKYFKNKEKAVLFKLNAEPELQLRFLEKILQERKPNENLDEDLIELYILLLCKSPDKKERKMVLKKLQEYETYTPKCLSYCQQYRIKDAWAYIEEKFGAPENIQKAIQLRFEIFEDYFKKCAKKGVEISNETESKILNKFRMMINILKIHGEHEENKYWFLYLSKLAHLHNEIVSLQNEINTYGKAKLISEILVEDMLFEIVKNLDFKNILEEIQKPSSQLNTDLIRKFFKKIVSNNYFENKLKVDTKTLSQHDLVFLINIKLIPPMKKAFKLDTNCSICENSLRYRRSYTFTCGHSFHLDTCIREQICPLCVKSEQNIISKHIMGKYIKKDPLRKKLSATNAYRNPPFKLNEYNIVQDFKQDISKNRIALLKSVDDQKNHDANSFFDYAYQKVLPS